MMQTLPTKKEIYLQIKAYDYSLPEEERLDYERQLTEQTEFIFNCNAEDMGNLLEYWVGI